MNPGRRNVGPPKGIWTGIMLAILSGAVASGCGDRDRAGGGTGSEANWSVLTTADENWEVWWRPIPAAIPARCCHPSDQ